MKSPVQRLATACLMAVLAMLALAAAPAMAELSLPPGFQDTELEFEGFTHGGLEEPTSIRFAPNGEVFVAQKAGEVLDYESTSDKTPTVFADLRTQVYDLGDRGILGMAIDPKFTEGRPYVYLLYSYDHVLGEEAPAPKWGIRNHAGDACPEPNGADDCLISGRLVRLTAEGPGLEHAATEVENYEEEGEEFEETVPAEKVLVEGWCQQFSSHSIGDLHFGPEGDLYASGGDGASFESADYGQFGNPEPNPCGDPPAGKGVKDTGPEAMGGSLRSQNPDLLNGKIIRIDPNTGEGVPGNPLYASSSNEEKNAKRIIAMGFRNPFRFTVDPKSHELYVGNVGWGTYEEIDRFDPPDGETPSPLYNSGWPCYEALQKTEVFEYLGLDACEALYNTPGSTSPPFFHYKHGVPVTPEDPCSTEYGSAIAGFSFYQGNVFPGPYKGALFFSDPVRQCIYVMFPGEGGEPDPSTTVPFLTGGGLYPGVDIEEGPEGDLYYAKLFGPEYSRGSIHKITYNSGNSPPVAHVKVVGNPWGPENEEFEFNAFESSDEDPEDVHNLVYSWDLNGDGKFEDWPDEGTARATFNNSQNHTIAVKVTDPHGASSIARVTVYPGDSPPEPEILEPSESLEWSVGDTIKFSGRAKDANEPGGEVPVSNLSWNSRLYHCPFSGCHTHPLENFPGVSSGEFIAPGHGYPTQIELKLIASDARGLEVTKTLHLLPKTVHLQINSEPTGLELSAGELTDPATYVETAIQKSNLTLVAPKTVTIGATTYAWQGWSDGGERVHNVLARCSAAYTAEYKIGTVPNEEPTTQVEAPCHTTPPQTTIDSAPSGTITETSATITFSASEPESSFECSLDGEAFANCTSPVTLAALADGPHTYEVRAIDWAGNTDPTPASASFVVSAHPGEEKPGEEGPREEAHRGAPEETPGVMPQTKLGKHPGKHSHSHTAKFTFSSSLSHSRFRCKLDRGKFRACSSPQVYLGLKPGKHSFEVIAITAAGADPTPAKFSWRIL